MSKLTLSAQEYCSFILDKRKKEWGRHFSYSSSEKEYPIPYSPKTRKPIKIPKDWTWMTIDQIAVKMNAGSTPRGGKKVYQNSGILFIRSQNVQMGRLETKNIAYISEEIHHKMEGSKVNYGDILLNITGASIGRIAWYNLKNYEANVNQHVSVIRLVEEIPDWIVLFFSTRWGQKQILDYQSGSTRQGLNINNQKQLMFPLTSLREQIKIVSILNNLEKILVNTEKTIEILKILKKGLMQRLFTEGIGHAEFKEARFGRIPKEWEILQLKEIGRAKDGDWILAENYSETGIRLLQIGDIGVGKFLDKSGKFITQETANELNCTIVNPIQELLISRMPDPIGRACIAPQLPYPYIVAVDITIFKPNEDFILPEFLAQILNSQKILKIINRFAQGATRQRISRKELEKVEIPIPSMQEQNDMLSILKNLDSKIESEQSYKNKLKEVKKGLMQDLLTGKRRVKIN